jgi:hypothetical protein
MMVKADSSVHISGDHMDGVTGKHGNVHWAARGPFYEKPYMHKHDGRQTGHSFYWPHELRVSVWDRHIPDLHHVYIQRFDQHGKPCPIQKRGFGTEGPVPTDEYRGAVIAMRDARKAFNQYMKHPSAHAPAQLGWLPGPGKDPGGAWHAQGRRHYGSLKAVGQEGLPPGAEVLGGPVKDGVLVHRKPRFGDDRSWGYLYDARTGEKVGARYLSDPGIVDRKGNFHPIVPPQDRAFRDNKSAANPEGVNPHGGALHAGQIDPHGSRGLEVFDRNGSGALDRSLNSRRGLTPGVE